MSNSYAVIWNVNVGDFVSVKPRLNGRSNLDFKIWEEQMVCLVESQDAAGFVDGEIEPPSPRKENEYKEWRRRDRLDAVWDQPTARATWLELHRIFDPRASEPEPEPEPEPEHESEDGDKVEGESSKFLEQFPPVAPSTKLQGASEREDVEGDEDEDKDESTGAGDVDYERHLALYRAAQIGDWDTARNIFNGNAQLLTAIITSDSETALHVAVFAGRANYAFVIKLVSLMPSEALAISDIFGKTALHNAAIVGNTRAARALLERNPELLYIRRVGNERLPVLEAAVNCQKDTLQYLLSLHEAYNTSISIFEGPIGIQLFNEILSSQFVDIALDLVHKYPNLTILTNEDDGTSALSTVVAATYTLFRRTEAFNWLQRFIYDCIPLKWPQFEAHPLASDIENVSGDGAAHKNYFTSFRISTVRHKLGSMIWNVVENLVPRARELKEKKASHRQALQLAEYLCNEIVTQLPEKEAVEIFKNSISVAVKYGVREIAEMIILKKPSVIYYEDPENGMNIFHLAASLRYENVFNLIYNMSDRKYMFFDTSDDDGNNLLHICGKLAPPGRLDRVTGAALQMQLEIQWFKEMEKFVNPSRRSWLNREGRTPQDMFSIEHKELRAKGETWMKETSNACTIAATLIATVMFASAFTIPGGLESTTGIPLFKSRPTFKIFAIADTISLFTSISSLLSFLSIVTSRYAEEDFLYLPKTLSIGMLCLFISILFMLVAFSVAVYLVLYANMTWFMLVLAAFAILPLTQFVPVLFPLLIDIISSTYGPGIFGKRGNRVLY